MNFNRVGSGVGSLDENEIWFSISIIISNGPGSVGLLSESGSGFVNSGLISRCCRCNMDFNGVGSTVCSLDENEIWLCITIPIDEFPNSVGFLSESGSGFVNSGLVSRSCRCDMDFNGVGSCVCGLDEDEIWFSISIEVSKSP